jgi:hypothetical protein
VNVTSAAAAFRVSNGQRGGVFVQYGQILPRTDE